MGFRNYGASPGKFLSGTVGTTASGIILARSPQRKFLIIHNPSSSLSLSYTLDGTTPVINAAGTITLGPLGTSTFEDFILMGDLNVIGSAASTPYTVIYDQ